MIFMRVSEHDAGDTASFFDQIGDVRHDEIDAGKIVTGERDPEVDDDPALAPLRTEPVERKVHPNLAHTAERGEHKLLGWTDHRALRGCRSASRPADREYIARRNCFNRAIGQPQQQPAELVECLKPAAELALGQTYPQFASRRVCAREPVHPDRRTPTTTITL